MKTELIDQLGDELYEALKACRTLEPLTNRHADITIDDAYAIQQRMMKRRLDAGEKVVGKKIGVTSKAVMNMLGVFQPDFGWLT
ncbi:MAG TPA: 2-oxopent-4-enoate hydratase, partial [Ottowia sp.]|nr:2-oxopent-4-enoate hydratase [Ottowia sp.]